MDFLAVQIKLAHGIFDSLKENFLRPTAWKFSHHEIGNKDIF